MAVGHQAAVVLRSRSLQKSANLLVQAEGLDPRVAGAAAAEVASLLDQSGSDGDISATMPGLPLACGSLTVNQGRHRVLYRMVGQLIVMVVTSSSSNALSGLDLLDRCVRVVTFDFRSPELSVERFGKRYQEVYMALSMLMSHGATITAGRALAEGRSALDAVVHGAAARKRDSNPGIAGAVGPQGERLEGTTDQGSKGGAFRGRQRTLTSQAGQLPMQLGFPTGNVMQPLKPLPGFEDAVVAAGGGGPRAVPSYALHQFALTDEGPPKASAMSAQDSALGSMLDELGNMLGPPVAGGQKSQVPKKGEDPFAFIEKEIAPEKKAVTAPLAPPPPVPPTPVLRLVETWRGEVRGGALVKAGHSGEVSCAPGMAGAAGLPVVGFALSLSGAATSSHTASTALSTARVLPQIVRPGWPLGYVVAEGSSQTGGEADLEGFFMEVAAARGLLAPVIMRYSVPCGPQAQSGWQPPVRMSIAASFLPAGDGRETAVMLGVQLQLDAGLLPHSVAGIEVRLHIPSLYELPSRVRPKNAVMDGSRRILTWSLPGDTHPGQPVPPGASADALRAEAVAFSAVFLVSGSVAAARAVLRTVLAEVEVRGRPGTTLSGVMLRQHGFVGTAAKAAEDMCSWKALITGKM